ncbi:MAG: ATP-binding protein [Aminipila sp.]
MNQIFELSTKLQSLVIFRNILNDNAISNLIDLIKSLSEPCDVNKAVGAYSNFVSKLFLSTTSLSDYILELVLSDENFYVVGKGQGKEFDSIVNDSLHSDLSTLNQLSALTASEVKSFIDYNGFLAHWTTSNLNFIERYEEHINNIHLHGYGIFSKHYAFVFTNQSIKPILNPDLPLLQNLPCYEEERQLVIKNTLSLINGHGASNVLLYGDAGTGKSSTIKAILNEYKDNGLRLIEIKKDELVNLPFLLEQLSFNPLKFILFIDDLSFKENDENFAALKAILEGSIAYRTNNIALYATSNRKHLVKEDMAHRHGSDLHINDTIQETLSLSARFGLTVTFQSPGKDNYIDIVKYIAQQQGLHLPLQELIVKAEAFAIRNGGRSPRTAKHFVQIELLKN